VTAAAAAFEVAFLHNVTRSDAATATYRHRQLHAAITLASESNIHSEKEWTEVVTAFHRWPICSPSFQHMRTFEV